MGKDDGVMIKFDTGMLLLDFLDDVVECWAWEGGD